MEAHCYHTCTCIKVFTWSFSRYFLITKPNYTKRGKQSFTDNNVKLSPNYMIHNL